MNLLGFSQSSSVHPTRYLLENGLSVIHQYIPTPSVAVDVWVRAGTTAEPDHWGGTAHLLEHLIFKGTDKLPPGAFDQIVENQGGVANAATSHDFAHFFITTAAQALDTALPSLADLLINAAIPDAEFGRERDVVLAEIQQAHDDPDWQAYQALVEIAYPHHPYGRSILGTQAQLMQRSPDQVRAFHRRHYQPQNMTVVLVGGVDQQALDLVHRCFTFSAATPSAAPAVEPSSPAPVARRRVLTLPQLEQARLLMAWVGPGAEQLEAAYGLDLISGLLAGGRTSRLVSDLREHRQIVHGISGSFMLQRQSSLFTLCAWLAPQHLELVEALIAEHLSALMGTAGLEQELARWQRLLSNHYAFTTEAPGQLAGLYGYYSTLGQTDRAEMYPHTIQALTPADLQDLAYRYLQPDRATVVVLNPA